VQYVSIRLSGLESKSGPENKKPSRYLKTGRAMTNLATGQPEANLSTRGKKVGLSGREFYNGNSGIEIFWAWLLVQRVFCKVISEIKNGTATDLH
jgi:hypothetical protein